jgi:hypothetical protein
MSTCRQVLISKGEENQNEKEQEMSHYDAMIKVLMLTFHALPAIITTIAKSVLK